MLLVKRIKAKNWKNFGNIDIRVGERLFIVGANASGKSNFLDFFRFLKDLSNNGLQKAVNARGGLKKIRNLNARKPSYIEVSLELLDIENNNQWGYTLQFNSRGGTADKPVIYVYVEKVICNDQCILNRKQEDDILAQYTHLEQPAMNTSFRVLFDTFRNINYVNIIPQLIRESESFIPSNAMEDFYGRNILAHISETNKKTRDSRLKKIAKVLQMAVPQFSDLEYMRDEKGHPHLRVRYEHFRQYGAFQMEDQFSDGTLRLIGIIWAILDGDGILLLEEPELYLHSEIVKQLPMFIAKAQKSSKGKVRQVFISSHSYELLNTDTISPEEIIMLNQGKEDTIIELADAVPSVTQKIDSGFTPAEAVIPHVAPKGVLEGQLSLFDL
ncbi:MAG: AAA family ATPase [Ruminococcus flavefaciens]|nr:AAA family ATPase [Roseburia sp.]MCM1236425.1 AAA family ATPase [Ruminococcus flavefaciens]